MKPVFTFSHRRYGIFYGTVVLFSLLAIASVRLSAYENIQGGNVTTEALTNPKDSAVLLPSQVDILTVWH